MSDQPRRGELWWCELPDIGRRPVVVISRDVAIPRLGRALIAPCTTTIRHLPSEVVLEPEVDPVPRVSAVKQASRINILHGSGGVTSIAKHATLKMEILHFSK